jgi:hypothetical protein
MDPSQAQGDALEAFVQTQNDLARQARRERRKGVASMATFVNTSTASSLQVKEPDCGDVEEGKRVASKRNKQNDRRDKLAAKETQRSKRTDDDFLKRCKPAIEHAKKSDSPPIFVESVEEVEKRLKKALVTEEKKEKKKEKIKAKSKNKVNGHNVMEMLFHPGDIDNAICTTR